MKSAIFALLALPILACATDKPGATVKSPLELKVDGIDGKEVDLSKFKGSVVLIVNVASQCGYTDQYTGLQALYTKNSKAGLVILGVPSNDFGKQEPGTNEEIQKFCNTNYKVTFPMLAKQTIMGSKISPLYKALTSDHKTSGEVGWNFEKFLINRKGEVIARFKSGVEPDDKDFLKAIQTELDAK